MADNTTLNPGVGGDSIAADDIGGTKFQRIKLIHGANGVNAGDVEDANGLPTRPFTTGTHYAPGFDVAAGANVTFARYASHPTPPSRRSGPRRHSKPPPTPTPSPPQSRRP